MKDVTWRAGGAVFIEACFSFVFFTGTMDCNSGGNLQALFGRLDSCGLFFFSFLTLFTPYKSRN